MISRLWHPTVEGWPRGRLVAVAALFCALFLAAMPVRLLYYSNQNTKFLHGMAAAFPERLGNDWTAQTVDGLPAFSFLVYLGGRFLGPSAFYLFEMALLGVMFVSLVLIARQASPRHRDQMAFLVAVAGVIIILTNKERALMVGVAFQYMADGYLQPSEFGILYLPALLLASAGRRGGLALAAVPAFFHPAYAAFSVILCPLIYWYGRRAGKGAGLVEVVLAAGLIIVPMVDLAIRFAPTDAETFARANEIIAFQRISHHSVPAAWLHASAWRKLALALVAICLAPAGLMRAALVVLVAYAAAGTAIVAATKNAELALVAPWRVSILVVPVSLALVIGAVTGLILDRVPRASAALPVLGLVFAVAGMLGGVERKLYELAHSAYPTHIAHVRATAKPDDEYLTRTDDEDFRLNAMAPQFVNWKTHPYLDTEVVAWLERVKLAQAVFGERRNALPTGFDCLALAELLRIADPTHVVVNTDDPNYATAPNCPLLVREFEGEEASIFAARPLATADEGQSVRRAFRAAPIVPSSR